MISRGSELPCAPTKVKVAAAATAVVTFIVNSFVHVSSDLSPAVGLLGERTRSIAAGGRNFTGNLGVARVRAVILFSSGGRFELKLL